MMLKKVVPLLVVALVSFSCVATLQNYNPKTPVEREIKGALLSYESAYNTHDAGSFLGMFYEDAPIMSPKDGSMLTKAQYSDMLSELFNQYPTLALGKPDVYFLEGNDKAVVEISMLYGESYQLISKVSLLEENNQWRITKLIYF
jgi:hypothetical protein